MDLRLLRRREAVGQSAVLPVPIRGAPDYYKGGGVMEDWMVHVARVLVLLGLAGLVLLTGCGGDNLDHRVDLVLRAAGRGAQLHAVAVPVQVELWDPSSHRARDVLVPGVVVGSVYFTEGEVCKLAASTNNGRHWLGSYLMEVLAERGKQ